jgi:hypothetical protein
MVGAVMARVPFNLYPVNNTEWYNDTKRNFERFL